MKFTKLSIVLLALAVFSACVNRPDTDQQMNPGGWSGERNLPPNTGHINKETNLYDSDDHGGTNGHGAQNKNAHGFTETARPAKIAEMTAQRGAQDEARPTLKIVEPAANSTVGSSTVKVKLELGGDLKGYRPMKDAATGMGNHIHVILDNQPYEAYYNLEQEFELRNVADGEHTLRVFPSRPWHESYKSDGAFQMIKFSVRNGGAVAGKPAATNSGQPMSETHSAASAEGKDVQQSTGGAVDAAKPLLTYSRPKGEYKGADAEAIMIDFWLANAKLVGDGGEYRVRYSIDGGEAKFIDKWQPIWISGWTSGKHSVKVELVDKNGAVVDNGGYNSTTREITIVKDGKPDAERTPPDAARTPPEDAAH